MTRVIQSTPESETIFIGFSFKKGKYYAEKLAFYLQEDFPEGLKVTILDVNLAEHTLYAELIEKMNQATLGLFISTSDIEEIEEKERRYYSRPNISFELGYMIFKK